MAHHQPPTFLLLLLLLFFLTAATTSLSNATAGLKHFKEAPKFYNSMTCPSITTTVQQHQQGGDHLRCSPSAIHVAMTLDSHYLRGSMAAILSILQHSACPENIVFHFITPSSSSLTSTILSSFPYLRAFTYPFSPSAVSGRISTSIRRALDSPLNYARNYLPYLLPSCLQRVTYLDSDLVLVDDVSKLSSAPLTDGAVLAAPEYCNANFTSYFTPSFWSNPSLVSTFSGRPRKPCYFNTGVMVIDLVRWREGDYTTQIVEWMELQKRIRIYELGSLPPFLLVFAGKIAPVDHRWNQHGLGGDNYRGLCRELHLGPVSLLHWSGKGKPWIRIDTNRPCPLDALWAPYDLLESSRRSSLYPLT